jgi:type I restriction enzyme S subunit
MRRVTVGDIAEVVSGGTPSRNEPEFWGGPIPWIKTGAISQCWITVAEEWITEKGLENSAARIVPKGTILMAMYGQGKTRGQVAILGIDAAINQACAALLLRDGCDRDFVYQQLAFRYASIRKISNTGSQDNLNAELVRNIAFPLPAEPEQRKIGEILGTWDCAVSALRRVIARKAAQKRGLMQELLTGKARFKEFKGQPWRRVHIGSLLEERNRYVDWDDNKSYHFASIRRRSGGLFDRGTFSGREVKTKVLKLLKKR